jgi:hypothetical protein
MYGGCTAEIMKDFTELWQRLPAELGNGTSPILEQIQAEFDEMMQNYMDRDFTCHKERAKIALKNDLKRKLINVFQDVDNEWALAFVPDEEEEEEEVEEEEYCMPENLNDLPPDSLTDDNDSEDGTNDSQEVSFCV